MRSLSSGAHYILQRVYLWEFFRREAVINTLADLVRAKHGGILDGAATWLAKKMGVAQPTASRWISGEDRPRERHHAKLAEILGVSPTGLLQVLDHDADDIHSGDRMVPIRREVFRLLGEKKDRHGFAGSTELYIESILVSHLNAKIVIRAKGVLAPREDEEQTEKEHGRKSA